MKTITYQGNQPSGFVQDVDGKTYPFKHGESFEVPAELAKRLMTQSPKDFTEAKEIVAEPAECPCATNEKG